VGGVPALFAVQSDGQATATVPRQAVNQRVRLSSEGGTALSPAAFQVTRPSASPTLTGGGPLTTDGTTAIKTAEWAAPAVTDLDGDGLLDVLVADLSGFVTRYEQATPSGPTFAALGQLTTPDATTLRLSGYASLAVTDLDGNGRLDLLAGDQTGTVTHYKQTQAGSTQFVLLGALTTDGTKVLNVGTAASPTVADVDNDSLLDLLVGNYDGNVLPYEQTAADGSAFALVGPVTANGTSALNVGNNAAPKVTDLNGDGLLELLVGNRDGSLARFEQTQANGEVFAPLGALTTPGPTALQAGTWLKPVVTDVDGDSLLDVLVGNYVGSLLRYEQLDVPTMLTLSPAAVAENAAVGTLVGTFTTTGAGQSAAATYALVSGDGSTDNGRFTIGTGASASKLFTAAVFDYEAKNSYTIRVRSTDANGSTLVQVLTVSITDVVEVPTISSFSPASGLAGTPVTITGTNLDQVTSVRFGTGALTTSIRSRSATSLMVLVPVVSSTGRITLTMNANVTTTTATNFTYVPRQNLTATLSPAGPLDACQPRTLTATASIPALTTGAGFDYGVESVVVQPDGKLLVGGGFGTYQGQPAKALARLNADGTLDASFALGTGFNDNVQSLAVQADGKVLVGGFFTSYQGQPANNLIRLNADGSRDAGFALGAGFDQVVLSVAVQADGKVLVGGGFSTYQGTPANLLARLNADGRLDTSFATGTGFNSATVNSVVVQADGKVLAAGSFSTYQGQLAGRIIRLNTDGSRDPGFTTGTGFTTSKTFGSNVLALAVQADGQVVVGGYFTGFYNQAALNLARLSAAGTLNTTATAVSGASFAFSPGTTTTNPLVTSTAGAYTATTSLNGETSAPSNTVVLMACPAPVLADFSPQSGRPARHGGDPDGPEPDRPDRRAGGRGTGAVYGAEQHQREADRAAPGHQPENTGGFCGRPSL
jgi:uncharacterized delta-60 repeat protein